MHANHFIVRCQTLLAESRVFAAFVTGARVPSIETVETISQFLHSVHKEILSIEAMVSEDERLVHAATTDAKAIEEEIQKRSQRDAAGSTKQRKKRDV